MLPEAIPARVELPVHIVDAIVEHARAEHPREACGLLAASGDRAVHAFAMRNVERSSVAFRLDPKEQVQAFDEIARRGWELFGVYHSHPETAAYPSATDIRLWSYPDAWHLIVSLADPARASLRAFRIVDGAVAEHEVTGLTAAVDA